jgi:hypothetical protein
MRTVAPAGPALIACAALAVGASTQAAGGKVISSRFDRDTYSEQRYGPSSYRLSVFGRIRSQEAKCRRNRTVRLYFKRGNKRHLRDTARSSYNGAVGLTGRSRDRPYRFIVRVATKRFEKHGRTFTCWSDRHSQRLARLPPA